MSNVKRTRQQAQPDQNVVEANYDDPDVIASLQAAYAAGLVSAEELDFYQAGGN